MMNIELKTKNLNNISKTSYEWIKKYHEIMLITLQGSNEIYYITLFI